MIGVRMNGLLNPPVAMIAPTVTSSSPMVMSRMCSSDFVRNCWIVTIEQYTNTPDAATMKRMRSGGLHDPEQDPGDDRDRAARRGELDQAGLEARVIAAAAGQRRGQAAEALESVGAGDGGARRDSSSWPRNSPCPAISADRGPSRSLTSRASPGRLHAPLPSGRSAVVSPYTPRPC